MSGLALIIPGADYSQNKIGNVTFQEDVAVTGIAINMNASYSGQSFQPSIAYTPSTTNQKGVTWSITAGGTYATIDSTTGLVTILSNASANSITVQAVSNYDNTVIATATTAVTYVSSPVYPTALTISGSASVNGQSSQYTVDYTPSTTNQQGVTWSITSGSTYASINATTGLVTILSAANDSQVVIRATSTTATTVYVEKTLTLTYEVSQIGRKAIISNPVDDASATAFSTVQPISEKYWNSQKEVTNAYKSGTIKDTFNLNWFNFVIDADSIATNLKTTYFTGNYTTIKGQGLGDTTFNNNYANVSALQNNTQYSISLFANRGLVYFGDTAPCVYPRMWLSNIPSGTYKFRIFVTGLGKSSNQVVYFPKAFWGINSVKVNLPSAEPSNFLDSPIEIEVAITDGNAVLYWGYTEALGISGSGLQYALTMLEIERVA